MAPPLLEVKDLTIRLPRLDPVRDLSFTVEPGETLAIVGESGSGKSMTALALMRLLPRTASIAKGGIRLDGQDLLALSEREMRKVRGSRLAMIFQEPMTSLNPVLTIGRQITEVLQLHEGLSGRRARDRAAELLDLVRIPEPRQRLAAYPHQLSGGQRQRVMIAIAVACGPRLLLADEPTTALDVTVQAQVLDLIDGLRRQLSMAVILITHNIAVVSQWADRVIVMYAGRQVEEADAEALLAEPLHPYTNGLLAASPRIAPGQHYRNGPLVEIPGNIGSAASQGGCPFAPRCGLAEPVCREAVPAWRELRGHRVACAMLTKQAEPAHALALGL